MVPSRTNDVVGKHFSTKALALAAKGNGDKLPTLVICKECGGQLGPRVLVIPDNVQVTASTNGCMTAQLYHWWLHHTY